MFSRVERSLFLCHQFHAKEGDNISHYFVMVDRDPLFNGSMEDERSNVLEHHRAMYDGQLIRDGNGGPQDTNSEKVDVAVKVTLDTPSLSTPAEHKIVGLSNAPKSTTSTEHISEMMCMQIVSWVPVNHGTRR